MRTTSHSSLSCARVGPDRSCTSCWLPGDHAHDGVQARLMPAIPTPRRELIAAGADAAAIDGALRGGRSVAVFRGVHVDAEHARGIFVRLRAALSTQRPGAVVAMESAAVLHRLRWLPPGWLSDGAVVHLVVRSAAMRRQRAGLRLHRLVLDPVDVVVVDGMPCMSVARTLVELARRPAFATLPVVQVIDGALRDGRTTRNELLACLGRMRGARGVARARRLIDRAREGVDSPQETAMRLMLEDGGVTGLDVNLKIVDEQGTPLAQGDLGIRRLLIWGEYDGYEPHAQRATFRSDRPKDRWLHRRGWHVMRFADADLARPTATCGEWLQAIADAPSRIRALEPSRSPEIAAAWHALGF